MRSEDLLISIGGIDLSYIVEASSGQKIKNRRAAIRRWTAFAACVLLVAGMLLALPKLLKNHDTDSLIATDEAQFTVADGKLLSYNGAEKIVVIPETITMIRAAAFARNASVETVVIPASVEEIEDGAFAGAVNLREITVNENSGWFLSEDGVLFKPSRHRLHTYPASSDAESYSIPEGIEVIASKAFAYSKLKSITFPESLLDIDMSAFMECDNLTRVDLPADIRTISFLSFDGCDSLREINIAEGNEKYCSVDGVVYSADKKRLVLYPCGKTEETFTVPDGVEVIELYAFSSCKNLKEVILPDSLTEIQYGAFMNSGLTTLNIPESVTNIDEMAFEGTAVVYDATNEIIP
jgi:hypothetical protein